MEKIKCINCTKFIQCSLDKRAKENKKECIYFIHRDEAVEELKEKISEYKKRDNMTEEEKMIEEIWLQVRRMLEDE